MNTVYRISQTEYLFQWSEAIHSLNTLVNVRKTRVFILSNVGVYIAYANQRSNIASSLNGTFITKLEHETHYFETYMKLQNELFNYPI